MANESKKKEIKEARDYYNEFVQAGQVDVATTDNFKCHKCGQRKCTYFQMQTRYAVPSQKRQHNEAGKTKREKLKRKQKTECGGNGDVILFIVTVGVLFASVI